MPISITPSDRSAKLWGTLAEWPLRIDLTLIAVSVYTLFFSLAFGVFQSGYSYTENVTDPIRLVIQLLPPLATVLIVAFDFWLHVYRVLDPRLMLGVSCFLFLGWACTIFMWYPDAAFVYRFDSAAWRVLGIAKMLGAALEFGLNGLYFVFASIAVHRLRRNRAMKTRPASSSPPASEHELELSREHPTSFIGTSILSTGTSIRCASFVDNSSKAYSETESTEISLPSYRTVG